MYKFFIKLLGKIKWEGLYCRLYGRKFQLTLEDWYRIKEVLSTGYFIVLTRRKTHLSTYACSIAHFFLTGKFGYYSHALVNVEGDRASYGFPDFKFVEAIGTGVQLSKWDQVLNVDAICVLKPRWYTVEEFDKNISDVLQDIGKKYDVDFKIYDDAEMSCVELARSRMTTLPDYYEKMRVFEYMIASEKNLTPQMFRDCPDFEVLLEIRK